MENSFFEYRNETAADSSDSGSEFIDNSLADESLGLKKKNHTIFVPESDESTTEDDNEAEQSRPQNLSRSVVGRSSVADSHVISSSEDDASNRGSIRRQSESFNKVVLSSSEEEAVSPEIVPKRRPMRKKSNDGNESIIGRKTKKRMVLIDSDTENSIIIEHDKHKKLLCMKDTPLKIDSGNNWNVKDCSMVDEPETDKSVSGTDSDDDEAKTDDSVREDSDDEKAKSDTSAQADTDEKSKADTNVKANKTGSLRYDDTDDSEAVEDGDDTEEYGIDEDAMVMSRATRMSIMGVIPKDNDSDESDFIQSDDSHRNSHHGSTASLTDLPEAFLPPKTPEKTVEDSDSSKISCSPFSSPLQDITNEPTSRKSIGNKDECIIINDTEKNASTSLKNKVLNKLLTNKVKENFIRYDDDVTIIDSKPEIIALSSDDDDDYVPKQEKKSPNPKPRKSKHEDPEPPSKTITKYLAPPSYPNQQVVYVKKQVREAELMKLDALKEDLKNIRYLLEEMDMKSLPDGGSKLIDRLSQLEEQVRRQGDKVASMVVEPENPTAADIARDGFNGKEKGPSWEELQKASNAVQPRMFGKQAMATHMAERNLILDRLRDLYESMGSRPAESQEAKPPRAMRSKLMPHQLHALAWLRWRETQRPRAGILADDMGLGKTITMIALIVSDKEDKIDDDEDDDDELPKKKLTRGGTLVVCPASLMQQWAAEVTKHCTSHALSVCLHHGAARAQLPHRLATYDLVVTTYHIMQRDHEKNGVLMRIAWRRVILDEAHVVRNHKSATCNAVTSLHASRRWCLTGTPVQNKDLDLFALLKFLRCSPFDDLTMWKKWIDNKSLGGQERLNTIMQCLLLRRTKVQLQQKGQLACLPKRAAHLKQVTLTSAEMNVYQKVLVFSKTLFAQFLHQRAEKNADAAGFSAAGKDSAYAKMHKKMIALQGAKPVKSHEILVLLLRLRQSSITVPTFYYSLPGDKAVIVSQWTSVLRLVEGQLRAARVKSVTLDGNVPVASRPPLLAKLNDPNSDVKVMLLSLCAGGVGLNLCGANHLLLLDPHWNPQLEEQAQDRIYRVGQTKDVNIYRFMCVDTVEQSIRKLQQAKLELAENVLTGAKNSDKSKLSIEDLKILFNMGQ
ncbi:hypothetical protein B5X24_HaOG211972 [Helicoverpa armigera]|uniref:Transcription termination factor 2 n=1 Tax=Helicoverpa armigera TaxID=29058 RepID=A0A2W1BFP7_HELAM|nr:hypothetical protein B5X24_HaOG211972 [Helicoverpa armigera]